MDSFLVRTTPFYRMDGVGKWVEKHEKMNLAGILYENMVDEFVGGSGSF